MSFSFVMPARHCDSGLSMMVVSIISTGAGSVAVSERPSLPPTDSTSGVCLMTASCHAMMRFTSVSDVLGSSTGMKSKLPSFNVGMNSLPMPRGNLVASCGFQVESFSTMGFGTPNASASAASRQITARLKTVLRKRSAKSKIGL